MQERRNKTPKMGPDPEEREAKIYSQDSKRLLNGTEGIFWANTP
jgi:hypothetical protein